MTPIWPLSPWDLFLLLAAPCVGSFLGVASARLPAGRPLFWSRSACDFCARPLAARDLVPLFSWALLRGACRGCGARIGFEPLLWEIGALAVAVWSLVAVPAPLVWPTAVLGWTLLTAAVIDQRRFILPDALTLPLIPAGLALAWLLYPERLFDHALGAALGYAALRGVAAVYVRLRGREGLGMGDAKLFAAAGAWTAWQALPSVLAIGAVLGLIVAASGAATRRLDPATDPMPFGPSLAAGFWFVWLYGPLQFG